MHSHRLGPAAASSAKVKVQVWQAGLLRVRVLYRLGEGEGRYFPFPKLWLLGGARVSGSQEKNGNFYLWVSE